VIKVQKHVNYNQIKGIFGFNESDNVGKFAFPPVQAVPAFSNTFEHIFGKRTNVPCLIPAAIDQDPYFRMTRDVAQKLKYQKPASIYSTFFPALQGLKSKMSSSDPNSAIFVTDTADMIKKKVNKYAFSGGQQLAEDQRRLGANLDVDVPYQWLTFFLEDDEELEDIRVKYSKGDLLTGEVKNRLIKCLQDWVKNFQERRKKVTNKDVEHFMSIRKINAVPARWGDISGGAAAPQDEKKKAAAPQGDKKKATAPAGSAKAPSAPTGAFHLFTDGYGNFDTAASQIISGITGVPLNIVQASEGPSCNAASALKVGDATISGAGAVSAYLARISGQTDLLGANAFEEAQVQQYIGLAYKNVNPPVEQFESVEYGHNTN